MARKTHARCSQALDAVFHGCLPALGIPSILHKACRAQCAARCGAVAALGWPMAPVTGFCLLHFSEWSPWLPAFWSECTAGLWALLSRLLLPTA